MKNKTVQEAEDTIDRLFVDLAVCKLLKLIVATVFVAGQTEGIKIFSAKLNKAIKK